MSTRGPAPHARISLTIGSTLRPTCLLGSTYSLASRSGKSTPWFRSKTSSIQFTEDGKSGVHMPQLVHKIGSLCPQFIYYRCQPLQVCHEFPSAENHSRIAGNGKRLRVYCLRMLLELEESIRERISILRAEIAEIARSNDEYLHISHTLPAQKSHTERRARLEEIIAELKSLSSR